MLQYSSSVGLRKREQVKVESNHKDNYFRSARYRQILLEYTTCQLPGIPYYTQYVSHRWSPRGHILKSLAFKLTSSYLFSYHVTSYHKKKTATSSRSITKVSKHAILLKPTHKLAVKAIFSHLVRRQQRAERSSKSTATSQS